MLRDLPGASEDTATVPTTAGGTEIQFTKNAAVINFVSGRAPVGGFTITSVDISLWAQESSMNANCGGRFRLFKRAVNGTETELAAVPFDDGVEFPFNGTPVEHLWIGNVTDTFIAEDERIVLKPYITAAGGTMASGHTCTMHFNGADGAQGDSFLNIAETVAFKSDAPASSQATRSAHQFRMRRAA